jgi:hypothetical protein
MVGCVIGQRISGLFHFIWWQIWDISQQQAGVGCAQRLQWFAILEVIFHYIALFFLELLI